ncbi:hypothetical protein [Micromonospora sp. NPDC049374]|uniref:hypothetical protein n=1 Tax=Micromonospora sp. NPDC049374 TaxID=3154352 RepID=UPI00344AE94E
MTITSMAIVVPVTPKLVQPGAAGATSATTAIPADTSSAAPIRYRTRRRASNARGELIRLRQGTLAIRVRSRIASTPATPTLTLTARNFSGVKVGAIGSSLPSMMPTTW